MQFRMKRVLLLPEMANDLMQILSNLSLRELELIKIVGHVPVLTR
jgi:hypothetical protein